MNREIYEGWTVSDFIEELEPVVEMIMSNQSWQKPFSTKAQLRDWCIANQPYYKKNIPEVVEYFAKKYHI